jgi:hypothetical protein
MKWLLIFFLTLTLPMSANAQFIIKDSVYFTIDDGIQTPEEMEEESLFVYTMCQRNAYQSLYFNCECLAGAFLTEREKLGPMVTQFEIMERLTKSNSAMCGNTEAIAGSAYKACMEYAGTSRELELDNEDYCACAANKMANDFTKRPRLSTRYVRSLRVNSMLHCREPANRPVRTSQPASNPLNN